MGILLYLHKYCEFVSWQVAIDLFQIMFQQFIILSILLY